jgi:hypothetical protein
VPYSEHPLIETPAADTPIWRYMNFVRLVSLLETRTLFFSRADRFNDPFEGSIVQNTTVNWVHVDGSEDVERGTQRIHDVDPQIRASLFNANRFMPTWTCINCWYAREHDSAAMWSLYASPTDGVAVKSTVGRLSAALSATEPAIFIGSVRYVDFATEPGQLGNSVPLFSAKGESSNMNTKSGPSPFN